MTARTGQRRDEGWARFLEKESWNRTAGEDGQDSAAKAEKRGQDGRENITGQLGQDNRGGNYDRTDGIGYLGQDNWDRTEQDTKCRTQRGQ